MGKQKPDLSQGTLDLLVLKALSLGPMHGYGVGITPPDFHYGAEADVTVPIGLQEERFRRAWRGPGS